jgi:hypothetical protein
VRNDDETTLELLDGKSESVNRHTHHPSMKNSIIKDRLKCTIISFSGYFCANNDWKYSIGASLYGS